MRKWTVEEIIDFYDANPDVQLRQLSVVTMRSVSELKMILMGGK